MRLTMTFLNDVKCVDYQINDAMTIHDALKVIAENDNFDIPKDIQYIYSMRKQENVHVHYSFKEAKIYSGDIIVVQKCGGKNK